jgi:hypothetical protein
MWKTIWQRYGLLLGVIALGLLKLWVVHTEEIYGSSTEYDALWYVGSAKHWYWGTNYGWTAFVRPCVYPLFIAVVHFFAIPLRLAIELAQMGGCAVLITALRKGGVPRWVCLVIFGLMVLHPASFLYNNHTMSESLYSAVLLLALGGSLLTLSSGKFVHAIWTGAAFALLWNIREESFLIPPIVVVIFLLALSQPREEPTRKAHFVFWLKRTGALAGTLMVLVSAVYSANYAAFHSFAKSDLSSPSSEEMFKALLRIKPSHSSRYVAVPQESLERAFEVSPTFARLKPQFQAPNCQVWTEPYFRTFGYREFGPYFMWALRSATASAGYYKDPVATNAFYHQAASEINQACDEGRIPCRVVLSGFLDPGALSRLRYLRQSVPRIARLFLYRHQKLMVRADQDMLPWMDSLYQEMVFRQPQPEPALHPESNAVVIPDTISARIAVATQNFIGAYYVYLFIGLAWAGLVAFGLLLVFHRRWRLGDPLITMLLLLGTTIAVRLVFLAFLEATWCWWMSGYERYLVPVMALTTGFLILLVYEAIAVWRKRNRPFPSAP